LARTSGALVQTPPGLLRNSPLSTYLVPGIILFTVNGLGQAAAGYLTWKRHRHAGLVGDVFGLAETMLAFFIDRHLRPECPIGRTTAVDTVPWLRQR